MSDRLLNESDVLRIAFQLPLVVNSVFADAVKALPSADRPQGMWELVQCTDLSEYFEGVKNGFRFRCSNCKDERKRNRPDMNFCPNCGAKMKGVDDGK